MARPYESEGSVSQEGTVKSFIGAEESFSLVPDEGFKVGKIEIDGQEMSEADTAAAAENGYTFKDLAKDHEMNVLFVKN